MIDLLVKYAHDHLLSPEPGFVSRTVKWALSIDGSGKFLEVIPLGDTSVKNNPGQEFRRCPEMSFSDLKALKGCGAHFLVETAQVVALYYSQNEEQDRIKQWQGKHRFFVRMLCDAAGTVPGLAAGASVLDNPDILHAIQRSLAEKKVKPTDKLTLMIDGQYPVDADTWHDWWRQYRIQLSTAPHTKRKGSKDQKRQMVCLATGELVVPAPTHPKIRMLADVGGLGMGSPLIGYDKAAFVSYGLEQSANGAMSEEVAAAYRDALEYLLAKHSQKLAGAKVVHWYYRTVEPQDDPLAWLESPPELQERAAQQRASDLLRSIRSGERVDLQGNQYYAMALSGAAGRVMVRDWMQGQFEDLAENIGKWFTDLSITRYNGSGYAKDPGIERVVTCLLSPRRPTQKYEDWIKSLGPDRIHLWNAALKGTPISFSALSSILHEHRSFMLTNKLDEALENKQDEGLTISLLHARMGLLKAFHIRKGGSPMDPYLNESHPDAAYHCGRLLAVLARLQKAALGDVGAGVIQRYYAAASTTPALVLGRLTRTSQFHLNKLDSPGLVYWYESKIASIWGRIQDDLPAVLNLERQSLFALGYYQQMAADRSPKSTDDANDNKEKTNA